MAEVVALVTAAVVLVTAVVACVTAVATWRTRRQVQQVHIMVNSQRAAMAARLDQLTQALQGSDTAVPPAPLEDRE